MENPTKETTKTKSNDEEIITEQDNSNNSSNDSDLFGLEDDDFSLFEENFNQDREGAQDLEDDEDPDESAEPDRDLVGDTTDEDEYMFRFLLSILDDTRAMGFSFWAAGNIAEADKYRYYDNLDAPKHRELLRAGRIVARKYKFSAMPELVILLSIVISSAMLWKTAAKDKKERQEKEEKQRQQPMKAQRGGKNTNSKKKGML